MQVHYLPPDALHDKTVYLDGPEAKHILKVRRLGVGDAITFADGRGRFCRCVIDRCGPKDLHANVESVDDDPREAGAPWSTLALALLKGDHFELAVEKCVELGVHRIIPLVAERCVVKLKSGQVEKRRLRWQRIAASAMKQSGRSWLPEVAAPLTVAQLVEAESAAALVVGDEEEAQNRVAQLQLPAAAPRVAVVGPEGALTPEEKECLAQAGAHAVKLSSYTLRAETAAVALVAALHGVESGS